VGATVPETEVRMRVALISLLFVTAVLMSASAQEPLSLVRSIELPHVEGRIDHLAFDPATERLYVAALGNNTVEVLDVKGGVHLKSHGRSASSVYNRPTQPHEVRRSR